VTALFMVFQSTWLNKWATCIPSEELLLVAKRTWSKALNGIPLASIQRAVDELTSSPAKESWPPSLPEFLYVCKRPTEARNLPVWDGLCLPETVSTPESRQEAEEARKKYRQLLGLK